MNDGFIWDLFFLVCRDDLDKIEIFKRKPVIHKHKNNFQKSILEKAGNFCKITAYENYTFTLISPSLYHFEWIYDKYDHHLWCVIINNDGK